MSYDIEMRCGCCEQMLPVDPFQEGGTQMVGGSSEAWLNVTYNYGKFYLQTIDSNLGIRWIYGKTGAEVAPILKEAIHKLGDDVDEDYWKATEGNAKAALKRLLVWAEQYPKGVFSGD